jgi:hypothetical protein
MKRSGWIDTGFDQPSAHRQNRRVALHGDTRAAALVVAD